MKKTFALFFVAALIISCGNPSSDSSSNTSSNTTTTNSEEDAAPQLSNELLKQEGRFYTSNSLSDDGKGIELHLKGGAYFIARDEKKLELEGISSLTELEGGEEIEVEYRLSNQAYTTGMAYTEGAKGKIVGFMNSVEGTEQSEEIDLVSYDFSVENKDAICTIKGKNKEGKLVEYRSSWSEMDKDGVYGDDFQLNTKSMEAIEQSGFYEKVENWGTDEDSGEEKGGTKLILLEGESKMAKILISTITYRLKEVQKVKLIQ